MYAVFQTGNKQYKVQKGDILQVELLKEDLGDKKSFDEVLLVGEGANIKVGTPYVKNAMIKTEVIAIEKGPKIYVFHKKRRQQFKRKVGHRQVYSRLLVTEIDGGPGVKEVLSEKEQKEILGRIGFSLKDARKPEEKKVKARKPKKKVAKSIAKKKVTKKTATRKKKKKKKKKKKTAKR